METLLTITLAIAAGLASAQTPPANLPPTVFPPYLQNPTADGMTICFLAQAAENVRVAWSAEGNPDLKEAAATPLAIPGSAWTMWKTRLTALKPGGAYRYQVRYSLRFGGGPGETPSYRFQTTDPQAGTLRVALFNDLHHQDRTLAALMRFVKPEDYEVSVLLGDCLEGHPDEAPHQWDSPSSREAWEPHLPGAKLDLMLAGHDHSWRLLPQKPDGRPRWPVIIGGGPSLAEGTVMLLTADKAALRVRLLAASDGRQLTEFRTTQPQATLPGK